MSEELTDAIAEAISDSLDIDWTAGDAARAIMANVPQVAAVPEMLVALYQYRDDLRHPPGLDSTERRLAMVNALIAKVTP